MKKVSKTMKSGSKHQYAESARRAQQIAGEILWLSTRTRPDVCYPIQKMTSAATKDPAKAGAMGTRIPRYLEGTKDFGLMYLNEEETKKKYDDVKIDWPSEVLDEGRVTVWTDSSFACQEAAKRQGAISCHSKLSSSFLGVWDPELGITQHSRVRAADAH
jgi:hypothetical protein